MAKISLIVNGNPVNANVDPRTLLVQFLRENLRLTGTHVGCDTSQCGACVVHVNGKAVKACTSEIPASTMVESCRVKRTRSVSFTLVDFLREWLAVAFRCKESTIKPRLIRLVTALSSLRASWMPDTMRPAASRA